MGGAKLLVGAYAIAALAALAPLTAGTGGAVTYTLAPDSRLDVVTRKAGLLGGFGHDHRIRARGFTGTIVHDPSDTGASSVTVTVQARDLHVLPIGADREDGPKVEEAMREDVLQVDRWPTIAFRSRTVTPIEGGVRVAGDLTLAGQTHPVTVDMRVQAGPSRIVADGRFSIAQTEWGIEPYTAALGTIRVADRVTFELHVVGVRAS
jgi:polyisoprenoid-binding protein YceI